MGSGGLEAIAHVSQVVVWEGIVMDTRWVGLEGHDSARVEQLTCQGLFFSGAASSMRETALPVGSTITQTGRIRSSAGIGVNLTMTALAGTGCIGSESCWQENGEKKKKHGDEFKTTAEDEQRPN